MQALLSNEHDYSENPFFLKYAYVALSLLLENIDDCDKKETPDQFLLEDYYDVKKNILVIDKENTAKLDSFAIENYTVALYKYGYSYKGKGNIFGELPSHGSQTKLTLKAVSKHLSMVPNINFLFREQLSVAEDEVIRFYLCYQIIELLIAVVFEDQFQGIFKKIQKDSEELFSQRDLLSKIAGEKYRIKLLFSNYVSCEASHQTELDMACKTLLKLNNKDISETYYENLYSVRCLLVHRLYSLTPNSYQMMKSQKYINLNHFHPTLVNGVVFSIEAPQRICSRS